MSRKLKPVPEQFQRGHERLTQPKGVLLSDVEREEVEWLWEGRIPRGKITVLDGDPGLGKSAFTTDLAARVSVGRTFPDGSECPIGGVVMMNAEDGLADTIRPRLDAAGGDPSKVLALAEIPDEANPEHDRVLSLPGDIGALEEGIARVGAALVVVDPLMAFLGGATDTHKDHDVRRALTPLKSLAERTGVSVLIVRHLNKGGGGSGNPLYRGGGSIAIVGAARSGLLIASDPNDAEGKRRVLAPLKNNLAEMPRSVSFEVVNSASGAARVEWHGESELGAADLVKAPLDEEEKSALDEATDFLRDALSGEGGRDVPMAAKVVQRDAKGAGIADATLRRAKLRLKVKSEKERIDGSWTWSLPKEQDVCEEGAQGSPSPNDERLEHVEHLRIGKPNADDKQGAQADDDEHLADDDYSAYLSEGAQGAQGAHAGDAGQNKQAQDDWEDDPFGPDTRVW